MSANLTHAEPEPDLRAALTDARNVFEQHMVRLSRYYWPNGHHIETLARAAIEDIDRALATPAEPKRTGYVPGMLYGTGGNELAPAEPEPDLPEYMCPNCVTPWKCNGPHIPDRPMPCQRIDPLSGGSCGMGPNSPHHDAGAGHDYTARDRRNRDRRAEDDNDPARHPNRAAPERPAGLDAAWAGAEAALPEGWVFHGVALTDHSAEEAYVDDSGSTWGPDWTAGVSWPGHCKYDDCDHDEAFREGVGRTPAEALRALAARLSETTR